MNELDELSFTVSGYIARPPAEVYEAVADPPAIGRRRPDGVPHLDRQVHGERLI